VQYTAPSDGLGPTRGGSGVSWRRGAFLGNGPHLQRGIVDHPGKISPNVSSSAALTGYQSEALDRRDRADALAVAATALHSAFVGKSHEAALSSSLARLSALFRDVAACIDDIAGAMGIPAQEECVDVAQTAVPVPVGEHEATASAGPSASNSAQEAAETNEVREHPVDWDALVAAAVSAIEKAPARLWRPSELVSAASIELQLERSRRGLHFGLVPRLLKTGKVSEDEAGRLQARAAPSTGAPRLPIQQVMSVEKRQPAPQVAEVLALEETIGAGRAFLDDLGRFGRTAQLAAWAGRARQIQEKLSSDQTPAAVAASRVLRGVFGRLTALTREIECDWIDALTPTWSTKSWSTYVAINEAIAEGKPPRELPPNDIQEYERAILRGLLLPQRRVRREDAEAIINEAREVLEHGDPDLVAAEQRFGYAPGRGGVGGTHARTRERPSSGSAEPNWEIPPSVRAVTEGKRALIVGGQGEREDHRKTIAGALGLAELEWATSERGQAAHFAPLAERAKGGRYDFVIFLVAYSSHKSSSFLRETKAAGIPIVFVPRGYSVASIARAIEDQLVRIKRAGPGETWTERAR